MKKTNNNMLIDQTERIFLYGGFALICLIEFFALVTIYMKVLSYSFIIPIAGINVVIGFIFLERAYKERNKLEQIKEIEILKGLLRNK